MRFFLYFGRILTLLLFSLLQACAPATSDSPELGSPLLPATQTPEPPPPPTVFPLPTSANLPLLTPGALAVEAAPAIPSPTPFLHTVKSGETISQIALRYGLTIDEVVAANPGINVQILSIGHQLQIPSRPASPNDMPLEPAQLTVGPLRCFPSGGGMWCFATVTNPHSEPVENVTARLGLFNADQTLLEGQEASIPLNILPAGASLPLAAFFPSRPPEPFSARLDLSTAFLLSPGDPRYLSLRVDNSLVQVSSDGLSAQVSGRVFLPQSNPPASEIWLAGVAYDGSGQIVGFRRWQSNLALEPGQSQTFSFNVYSLGGSIERFEIQAEARP